MTFCSSLTWGRFSWYNTMVTKVKLQKKLHWHYNWLEKQFSENLKESWNIKMSVEKSLQILQGHQFLPHFQCFSPTGVSFQSFFVGSQPATQWIQWCSCGGVFPWSNRNGRWNHWQSCNIWWLYWISSRIGLPNNSTLSPHKHTK